jgi:hypothetical protein
MMNVAPGASFCRGDTSTKTSPPASSTWRSPVTRTVVF